ncbi:lytic transglycosylase domain-containing protein [Paracoccus suum]|uniref:Lytic transglycosylase domain-containing protein n=1 Tax=Paracoccus suum TaxID=2259340 RepID=A0A344PGJ1_9RHOB|nr:lytic transglycosylase domain-containing protein [Paracoccus suum]AXC48496.1 lytic transglycosylase domain-containing protein [Paracoccus suum]
MRSLGLRSAGLACGLAVILGAAAPPAARAEDAVALRRAMADIAARDWAGAQDAARASGPLAADIVAWHQLRAGRGSLAEYTDFMHRHPNWPGLALMRERAEAAAIPATAPAAEVLAWFGEDAPLTGTGMRRLIAALSAAKGREAAGARLAALWASGAGALSPQDESALLAEWGAVLAAQNKARAAALLDRGEWQAARRMLPRLTGDDRALATLRADLQAGTVPNLALRLTQLPRWAREDAGLALDHFRAAVKAKDRAEAEALMLAQSTSAEALRDPALWARVRADYARAALRAGDPKRAQQLASGHWLKTDDPLWTDLEWLAGYAAYRAGDWPAAAARFQALGAGSAAAITQSRALYWQSLTAARRGDQPGADALMRRAATHQTTWYGQLAAEAAGVPMDPQLVGGGPSALPNWRASAVLRDDRVQAAIWLMLARQPDLAQRFLLQVSETASAEDIGRLARLMAEFRQTHHSLRLAKVAAQKGAVYPAALFPLTGLEADDLGIPPELALAIARRESEFNPRAASGVGARGLMQVMPATAREIAVEVGLPFDLDQLSRNPDYNALYGATYLARLRARYGPSIALVAAGYNAGPGRSAQWLKSLGEIRSGADPVEWVEAIPFDETRNYVMRVAEALPIYRARIAGAPVPLTPTEDLTGGGVVSIPIPRPILTLTASLPPPPNPRGVIWAAREAVMGDPAAPAAAGAAEGGAVEAAAPTTAEPAASAAATPAAPAPPASASAAAPATTGSTASVQSVAAPTASAATAPPVPVSTARPTPAARETGASVAMDERQAATPSAADRAAPAALLQVQNPSVKTLPSIPPPPQ